MADIDYPSELPQFNAGKQRRERQGFVVTNPLQGSAYVELRTDDLPVMWDVTITCISALQAQTFLAFLRSVKGGRPFNKSILTEYGFQDYEVAFAQEPREPEQISPNVWRYSATIYAQQFKMPRIPTFITTSSYRVVGA